MIGVVEARIAADPHLGKRGDGGVEVLGQHALADAQVDRAREDRRGPKPLADDVANPSRNSDGTPGRITTCSSVMHRKERLLVPAERRALRDLREAATRGVHLGGAELLFQERERARIGAPL